MLWAWALLADYIVIFLVQDLFLTSVPITVHLQVWNSVGIVRCHTEDEISSIEVEFHDTSTHHPLHLTNHLNHTMAALSSTAVLLACKAHEDSPRYCNSQQPFLSKGQHIRYPYSLSYISYNPSFQTSNSSHYNPSINLSCAQLV